MRVLLVGDDDERVRDVRGSLRPDDTLKIVTRLSHVGAEADLSQAQNELLREAEASDVVLFLWDLDAAPTINALTHALRDRLKGPSIALCMRSEAPEALASGADAVLHPPFDMAVLEAKRLAHRRLVQVTVAAAGRGMSPAYPESASAAIGGLQVDPVALVASFDGRVVRLTPREAALLGYLVRHVDRVCSREELLDRVWGIHFETGTNMVDVYVHFIRRRIEALGWPHRIETVRGSGYRLTSGSTEDARRSPR